MTTVSFFHLYIFYILQHNKQVDTTYLHLSRAMNTNVHSQVIKLCTLLLVISAFVANRLQDRSFIVCHGFQIPVASCRVSLSKPRYRFGDETGPLTSKTLINHAYIDKSNHFQIGLIQKNVLYASPNNLPTNSSEYESWPFALILFSQLVLFIGVGAIIPAIPLYGQSIGLSQAANGIVISAPAIMLLLCAQWGGNFADRARKPAMMLGMALIALSDIGTAFASTLPVLIFVRLGLGAGRCIAESGERGMIADIARQVPTLRGRALAAQQAITALGISIGAPMGGLVIDSFGPRATFLCVSAGALVALFLYSFLPETVASNNNMTKGDAGYDTTKADWSLLAKERKWQGLALCQSGATFGFAAKIASIPIIATTTLPGGALGTGALLSLAGLSGIVGAPLGGWLTDKVGARFTVTFSGCVSAIGLILIPCALNGIGFDYSGVGSSIPFPGGSLDNSEVSFVCAVLLWSLGAASQGPALTALAQELAPLGEEAIALAFPRAAGDSTYIFAPFILGTIADKTSTTVGLGLECAVAGIVGLLGTLAFVASMDRGR